MRKLIMWNMVTLDGAFEGAKPWDIGWHALGWGDELERLSIEQLHAAGGILFGRKTYEGMAAYWTTAKGEGEVTPLMNAVPKYVCSRTLERAEWNNTRLLRRAAEDEVARLNREDGKDLFLFGSADLGAALSAKGLIDEYRLAINPIVLGNGRPLFRAGDAIDVTLLEARPLKTGAVLLCYARNEKR